MTSAEASYDAAAPDEQQALLAQLQQAVDAGDCDTLVALMRANVSHGQVQLAGCDALIKLCAADEFCPTAGLRASSLEALTVALQAHRASTTVVARCFCALSRLFNLDYAGPDTAALVAAAEAVVAVVREHPGVSQVLQHGFVILIRFVRASQQVGAAAVQENIFTAIVAGMRAHAAVSGVQLSGCRLLSALAFKNVERHNLAVQAGAAGAVLATLRTHGLSDASLAAAVCDALCTLTADDKALCLSLIKKTDVGLLLALITGHALNERVQKPAFVAVTNISMFSPRLCMEACRLGVLKHVTEAMQRFENIDVQGTCCMLVALGSHAECRVETISHGAIEHVVTAMRVCIANVDIVGHGCGAIYALVVGVAANADRARCAGAVDVIVQAMRLHAHDENLQHAACVALEALCADDATLHQMISAGAFAAVVAAMRAHAERADVQDQGCSTLQQMLGAASKEFAEHACAAGALEALCATSSVCRDRFGALFQLMLGDPERCRIAADAGAIPAVVQALRTRVNDPSAYGVLCRLLGGLTQYAGAGAAQLCAAGGVELFVAAMRRHPSELDVHLAVCEMIVHLDDEFRSRACAAGVLELLVTLHTDVALGDDSCAAPLALAALACTPGIASRTGELGAVEALVAAMRARLRHPEFILACCRALTDLAQFCSANVERATKAGVLPVISAALRTHRAHAEVQQKGAMALRLLEHSATADADAAMAALLAEEEAEQATRQSAQQSKKKRGGGKSKQSDAGASGSGAAPATTADQIAEVPVPAAPEAHHDADHQPAAPPLRSAEAERRRRRAAAKAARRADDSAGAASSQASSSSSSAAAAVMPEPEGVCGAAAAALPPDADTDAAAGVATSRSDAASPSRAVSSRDALPAAPPPPPQQHSAAPVRAPRAYEPPSGPAGVPSFFGPDADASLLPPFLGCLTLNAPMPPLPPLQSLPPLPPALPDEAAAPLQAAPPPPPPPVPQPEVGECCVCLEDVALTELLLLWPCTHRCVCAECSAVLLARPPARRLCPICSEPVAGAARVFDVVRRAAR
jgi:hypothetical protein